MRDDRLAPRYCIMAKLYSDLWHVWHAIQFGRTSGGSEGCSRGGAVIDLGMLQIMCCVHTEVRDLALVQMWVAVAVAVVRLPYPRCRLLWMTSSRLWRIYVGRNNRTGVPGREDVVAQRASHAAKEKLRKEHRGEKGQNVQHKKALAEKSGHLSLLIDLQRTSDEVVGQKRWRTQRLGRRFEGAEPSSATAIEG